MAIPVLISKGGMPERLSRNSREYGMVRGGWRGMRRVDVSSCSVVIRGGIWAYGSGSVAAVAGRDAGCLGSGSSSSLWGGPDDAAAPPARPLVRPAPRSAMVFPLVVLVAVLPGLVALNAWDLTPPGPMWGLRGLAVLDGLVLDQMPAADAGSSRSRRRRRFERWPSSRRSTPGWRRSVSGSAPTAIRWPASCPATWPAALAVVLVYLHGRLWRGAGLGLTAAILVGFNQNLLLRMQEATPSTLALCGVLAVLAGLRMARAGDGRVGASLAVGRPGRLGGRRRPGAGPGPAGAGRIGPDRHSDRPAAPVLPARRLAAVLAASASAALVALLAGQPGLGRRPAGSGDRAGRGLALVRPDGPVTWLGGNGGARGFLPTACWPTTSRACCRG